MEAQKLRFVRCPKCLQLLVEYPSIPVYQCGGCGTVLRAKNRGGPVPHTDSESGEHNNFTCSMEGSPQNNRSVYSDEQKIESSNAQPCEDTVEGKISSDSMDSNSCDNVNQEKTVSVVESAAPGNLENEGNCSLTDENARNAEFMTKETDCKDTGINSIPKLIDVEIVETGENVNGEKGSNLDDANDGGVGSEVPAVHRMAVEELEVDSDNYMRGAMEIVTEEKCYASNTDADFEETAGRNNVNEQAGPNSNSMVIWTEETSQPFEGLRVECYEDLLQELERSLSYSDDDEEFVDVTDSNGLNDALHQQIDSRRFLPGGKIDDASRSDPHGRLIEELERSFSDADEPTEDNVMVVEKDIAEKIHGDQLSEDPQSLVDGSPSPCEGSICSFDNGHVKSGQSFQQNELTADGNEEKEDGGMEHDNKIDCGRGNNHVVGTKNDTTEEIHGNEHDKDLPCLDTESANLCERSIVSSNDGYLKSGQSFQQNELTAAGSGEMKQGHTEDDNMTSCVEADNAAAAVFSSVSNDRIHCKSPSFNKKREEISCRYRASLLRQGLSLDSEDFKSIQNLIQSHMDGTSSSFSSESPRDLVQKTPNNFKAIDQLERFKKMDELRDQLSRLSSQKGLEKRYQKKGLEYQPQLNSYEASFDGDSIPSSCTLESYYGHGKSPKYPLPNPFSPPQSWAQCHYAHVQTHIPHIYDAWEFNSYYQSSHAASSILDHDSLKLSFKEQKRVVMKHILRPLSGASPYTVCNGCFHLVQMPADIYMSKTKIGKMQCGRCSKVIVLSFSAVKHADADISKELTQKSSKTGDAACHSVGEYGTCFSRSFSTRVGPALTATQSSKRVSESALHRLMGYDSASQLLHHSRVFDDGYDSFESMVPVSNRVARRKNI